MGIGWIGWIGLLRFIGDGTLPDLPHGERFLAWDDASDKQPYLNWDDANGIQTFIDWSV